MKNWPQDIQGNGGIGNGGDVGNGGETKLIDTFFITRGVAMAISVA